jgi:hypothetical protein
LAYEIRLEPISHQAIRKISAPVNLNLSLRSLLMRFRRLLAMAATVAVVTCGLALTAARAQQPQRPVAIVSISPLDRFLQDTSYLLKACNVPEVGGLVGIMANQYTQGIDRTKPLGVSVTLDGQIPNATVFLPLKSREDFFGALAGMGIEPDDLGGRPVRDRCQRSEAIR